MAAVVRLAEYGGGDGGGPFDPRDFAIAALEHENAEFRSLLRRLLDVDGPEAGEVIAEAERLLAGLDQIDREDEADRECEAYVASPTCDNCDTYKGVGSVYCPECDADALERLNEATMPSNV